MKALLLLVMLGGCDSKAKASDPQTPPKDERSKEFESCATSRDCAEPLRCFDNTCRRQDRSNVGDYFAAVARNNTNLEQALGMWTQAIGQYDVAKLKVPADIDCGYGGALARLAANKEHAELGARVLHRCLLAVPVGSRLREQALADLALINDAGLDALTLAKTQLADLYLTRAAKKPASDKLSVSVTGLPQKSNDAVVAKLNETDTHSALITCWQNSFDATHKDSISVTIGVKSAFIASEYEDEQGVFVVKLEPTTATGPDAAVDACVRSVVEPVLKTTAREGYNAKLAVTVK